MCYASKIMPGQVSYQGVPLWQLGKRTNRISNGLHVSGMGAAFPIGKTVFDPNEPRKGVHDKSYHFAPLADVIGDDLKDYGDHQLVIFTPIPSTWTSSSNAQPPACWHSDRGFVAGCLTCGDGVVSEQLLLPSGNHQLALPAPKASEEWVKQILTQREEMLREARYDARPVFLRR